MKFVKALNSVVNNKCPRCHKGHVFLVKNPYRLKKLFNMYSRCNHCNLEYEREPGFFFGAMFVSYALAAGWFMVWYAIQNFFLNLDTLQFAIGLVSSIVIMSPLSLRWSRLIWMNFFFKFDEDLAKSKGVKQ